MRQHRIIENFGLAIFIAGSIFISGVIFYNALYNQPARNYVVAGDSIAAKIFTPKSEAAGTRTIEPKIDGLDNIIKKMTVPKSPPKSPSSTFNFESETIAKIQAGLKNYGYDDVVIDGKQGEKTKTAIQKFQLEFNMEITGKADEQVLNKLKEIGAFNQT